MHLKMSSEDLALAMSRTKSVASGKTTMPILNTVHFRAEAGAVHVTAFDLEVAIISDHAAEVLVAGSAAIDAKLLANIASGLPEAGVEVRLDKGHAEILSGKARYRVPVLSAEEYPSLPKVEAADAMVVDPLVFASLLEATVFAVSTDEGRTGMRGLQVENPKPGVMKLVGTDGHRLSFAQGIVGDGFALKKSALIPRSGARELLRVVQLAPTADCRLHFGASLVSLQRSGMTFQARLLEEEYPPYHVAIPKVSKYAVEMERDVLADAIKRVQSASSSAGWVSVDLRKGELQIKLLEDAKGAGAEEVVEIDYSGDTISMEVNSAYLVDNLKAIPDERVRFSLNELPFPAVIQPADGKDRLTLVMPRAK